MRRVECWACGKPLEAPGRAELSEALAAHLREEHGGSQSDVEAVEGWIDRHASAGDVPLVVLTAGRVLSGAAGVTFTLLAFLNPTEIGGTERTIQFLSYLGFAALAGGLLCALTLLGRLLQR